VSSVAKLALDSVLRTFRLTSSPNWSWRSSVASASAHSGAAGASKKGLACSSSRLLVLSGRTALYQLMTGLYQAILVRQTSLPTPSRLIMFR